MRCKKNFFNPLRPIWKISSLLLLALLTLSHSCETQQSNTKEEKRPEHANRLIHEDSPYLLQHAYNPVEWYPWGEAAFEKAQRDSKLVIISVGYAACHWCHVMEKESFADSVVAALMNKHFVAIKVDREERPDVDQIYMDAAHLITGQGGWPLNAIALPDGRPVYAGTYFPKKQWLKLLQQLQQQYDASPKSLRKQAQQLTAGIRRADMVGLNPEPPTFTATALDTIWSHWLPRIDFRRGGKQGAPKFPLPNNYQFLLRYHYYTSKPKVLEAVHVTLENMAYGGIYDQLGGGFARYSTDKDWKVPHFEKMLYDNAQLVSLYAEAWQHTRNPLYKQVVYETLAYIKREMTHATGGFYSSLDADSEGEEGTFYVWTYAEIKELLKDEELELATDYYNITRLGNWEGRKNVLHQSEDDTVFADKHDLTLAQWKKKREKLRKKLFRERAKRVRPALDDKVLTAWNALMLKGYVDAYRAFQEPAFLEAAQRNARFLQEHMQREDDGLYRSFKDGNVSVNGFLDDYSFTIEALLALYEVTFEEEWLHWALQLADYAKAHFYNSRNGMFYYTSDLDPKLIARKTEVTDNVIPASNSSMAKGLYRLGQYFYKSREGYTGLAEQMLANVHTQIAGSPPYFSNWAILMTWIAHEPYEVAIVGEDCVEKRLAMENGFMPDVLWLGGATEGELPLLQHKLVEGETTIYVCRQKVCKMPVTEPEEARKLVKEGRRWQ